jgi:hypothetical protein
MVVQNTGKKCIGFGVIVLPPDGVGTLPEGFGPDHPTVSFYISKKWLTVLAENNTPPQTAPVTHPAAPPQDPPPELTEEEKVAAQKKAEIDAKVKAFGRLNLEPLRVEATTLGVAWAETDTKNILLQKITEKLQAEMG